MAFESRSPSVEIDAADSEGPSTSPRASGGVDCVPGEASSDQKTQPAGAGGQEGLGLQSGPGCQPAGGTGQFGGEWNGTAHLLTQAALRRSLSIVAVNSRDAQTVRRLSQDGTVAAPARVLRAVRLSSSPTQACTEAAQIGNAARDNRCS